MVGIGIGDHFRFSNKQKGTSSKSRFLRCIILENTDGNDHEEKDADGAPDQTEKGPEDGKTEETPDENDEGEEDSSPLAIHQHTSSGDKKTASYVLQMGVGARS